MSPTASGGLFSALELVSDLRGRQGQRHPFAAMLAAVVCARLCGARGFNPIAQWVRVQSPATWRRLGFRPRLRCADCFADLFAALDPEELERAIQEWTRQVKGLQEPQEAHRAVSMDDLLRCGAAAAASRTDCNESAMKCSAKTHEGRSAGARRRQKSGYSLAPRPRRRESRRSVTRIRLESPTPLHHARQTSETPWSEPLEKRAPDRSLWYDTARAAKGLELRGGAMSEKLRYRSDRNSGGLLASTVVLMVGFFGCLFVGMLQFPRQPLVPWLIGGGAVVVLFLLVWMLRDRPSTTMRDRFRWLSRRSDAIPGAGYEPRLVKLGPTRYGTRRPPTTEEIRDLKDNERNWVPSNSPGSRRSLRKQ